MKMSMGDLAEASGFNLPILECKSYLDMLTLDKITGFNLPILECKCVAWCAPPPPRFGFNLPILECKSVTREQFQKYVCVLIYPYWNVNRSSVPVPAFHVSF